MLQGAHFAILIFLLVLLLILGEFVPRLVAATLGTVLALYFIFNNDPAEMFHYVDFTTIGVLIGMYIIVDAVQDAGVFQFIAVKAMKASKGDTKKLFLSFCWMTAFMSTILSNVVVLAIAGSALFFQVL